MMGSIVLSATSLSATGFAILATAMFSLGLVLGSFANVVIARVPRGESIVHPGSHCPSCASPVRPRDNIPVISWLALRGQCRDCGWSIPARYPLVELASGLGLLVVAVLGYALYRV
jgi:leader peptidase (prepilin peptidase)/N-methyltransferase